MTSLYLLPPFAGAVAIYSLSDPRDGHVRYVGKSVEMARRYQRHLLSPVQHPTFYSSRWIAELQKEDCRPLLTILAWVEAADWEQEERFYISFYRMSGAKLTNATEGGEGHAGLRPSLDVRKKMSDGQKRRWAEHPEHKEQISSKLRGRQISEEERARRSDAQQRRWDAVKDGTWIQSNPKTYVSRLAGLSAEEIAAKRSETSRQAYETRRALGKTPRRKPKSISIPRSMSIALTLPERRVEVSA